MTIRSIPRLRPRGLASAGAWVLGAGLACGDVSGQLTPGSSASEPLTGSASAAPGPTTGDHGDADSTPPGATEDPAEASGDPSTGAPPCEPGDLGCTCLGEFCREGGSCVLGECAPYTQQCDEFNGVCDEGTLCAPGTDPFDCCATKKDGVCEEKVGGGTCPKGSDIWDCGYCPNPGDYYCDPECAPGTDFVDCCPNLRDGVCEDESQGGPCPDGGDYYDCGYCPFLEDGYCAEPLGCPPGTDGADCCAGLENGVCEEESQGGPCPETSDFYDCGYCPWAHDFSCNEPQCPPGSDFDDCCAAHNDGVCEEEGHGGACPVGSDFYDCGYCPAELLGNEGCDEPDTCPPGTDVFDCCATKKDGKCEEIGQGGPCPDGSDNYDCGVCPTLGDGYCQEPDYCPPGTDQADCCATTLNGICEEVDQGGPCPEGSDFYDCGECPTLLDGHCDEPMPCPPGSDVGDCA